MATTFLNTLETIPGTRPVMSPGATQAMKCATRLVNHWVCYQWRHWWCHCRRRLRFCAVSWGRLSDIADAKALKQGRLRMDASSRILFWACCGQICNARTLTRGHPLQSKNARARTHEGHWRVLTLGHWGNDANLTALKSRHHSNRADEWMLPQRRWCGCPAANVFLWQRCRKRF